MLKKEKGVSLIILVITVIVMLILAGIIVYEGTGTIKEARKQSIYTNLLLIQAKTRTINDKVEFQEAEYIGKVITDNSIKEKVGSDISNDLYELNQEDLNQLGVDVKENDYAVDYKNDEVYYLKGIEDEQGNLHYSLTDIAALDISNEK